MLCVKNMDFDAIALQEGHGKIEQNKVDLAN